MKDRLLKRLLPLFAAVFMLFAAIIIATVGVSYADSYVDEESGKTNIDTNWWFEDIDVEIDVRRDKTLSVTETMRVGFIEGNKNTGIIRDIQRISQTTRIVDGEEKKGMEYLAQISDVSVTLNGQPAKVTQSLYEQGQFHSVKMQLPDGKYFPATDQTDKETLDATLNTFVLKYVYDMSDDKAEGFDDFTFDVLGYAMDYTRRFHAKITFPDAVNADKVSFRTNKKKPFVPDVEDGESVSVSENVVELTARPNKEHVGYTVQVLFDDGYFSVTKTVFWYYFLFLAAAAAAIVCGGLLVMRFSSNNVVETVEFYPPKDMRALRFAAVWRGKVNGKDLAAVVAQWADEGYVRIYKDGDKHLIVRKLKDMSDDVPNNEREYFDTMFAKSSEFHTRSVDSKRDVKLSKKFQSMQTFAEEPPTVHKRSKLAYVGIAACMVLPFVALFIYYCIVCQNALPLFFLIFIAAGTMPGMVQAQEKSTPLMYIFPLMFTAMPMFAFIFIFYMPLYDYAGLIFIAPIWYAILLILSHFMNKKADYVLSDYGKMLGFKRFLLTAELSRIEMLFEEDPDYFSHIIPYCLIMGIGKKVEKRFAALNISAPEWSDGIGLGAFSHFSHTLATSSGMGSSGGGGGGGGHGGSSGGGGGGGGSRGC